MVCDDDSGFGLAVWFYVGEDILHVCHVPDGVADNDDAVSIVDGWVATGVSMDIGAGTTAATDHYIDNLMISDDSTRDFYNDTFNGTPYKDLTESPR